MSRAAQGGHAVFPRLLRCGSGESSSCQVYLAVDGGFSLSGSCKHASPREIIASPEAILGAPVPRMEAGSPRQSASHNTDETDGGVSWLCSFPSADQTKTDCLDDAPSAEAIREAARRANGPAAVIVEVGELRPATFG